MGVMKKTVRAFFTVMKRLLVDFPEERVGKDELDHLANLGKRGVKRPVEEKTDIEDHAAVGRKGSARKTEAALTPRSHFGHGGPNPGVH